MRNKLSMCVAFMLFTLILGSCVKQFQGEATTGSSTSSITINKPNNLSEIKDEAVRTAAINGGYQFKVQPSDLSETTCTPAKSHKGTWADNPSLDISLINNCPSGYAIELILVDHPVTKVLLKGTAKITRQQLTGGQLKVSIVLELANGTDQLIYQTEGTTNVEVEGIVGGSNPDTSGQSLALTCSSNSNVVASNTFYANVISSLSCPQNGLTELICNSSNKKSVYLACGSLNINNSSCTYQNGLLKCNNQEIKARFASDVTSF